MKYIFKQEGKRNYVTKDRAKFENYVMANHPDVAYEVRYFGVRYYLSEENPLEELCEKVAEGFYEDYAEGDLFIEGLDALEYDQVKCGGNFDPNYTFHGIRIEEE